MTNTSYRRPGHACDAECTGANGDASACVCECGGTNHGAAHRRDVKPVTDEQVKRAWSRIPAPAHEEAW